MVIGAGQFGWGVTGGDLGAEGGGEVGGDGEALGEVGFGLPLVGEFERVELTIGDAGQGIADVLAQGEGAVAEPGGGETGIAAGGVERGAGFGFAVALRMQPGHGVGAFGQAQGDLLAAAADGGGQAVRAGGDQQQVAIGCGFFERLQQGVGGVAVEQVGGVDDRHLRPTLPRGEHQPIGQLAHLLDRDFGAQFVGLFVEFQCEDAQVGMAAGFGLLATPALAAGADGAMRSGAEQALCEGAGQFVLA